MTYLTATEALTLMRQGNLQPSSLLNISLERIRQREQNLRAWQSLAVETACSQALLMDQKGPGMGAAADLPLRGIPVAIKDIFSTADLPTTWGTSIYQGRYLAEDAAVVARLKSAGAIILGTTVTTEFATAAAGPTRNPHNLEHTPGGSSSGSAAAVADSMVPIALGSQTMGSILRPAAYCGFKPSFGVISHHGMMPVSAELDHVGLFACAFGLATHHGEVIHRHRDQVSDLLLTWVERGERLDETEYKAIQQRADAYRSALSDIFAAYDAILTPVTTGAAPPGLESTGSPIFCGLWTLCGVPAINLPLVKDPFGLPLGCQLVGKYLADFSLLTWARWCWAVLVEDFGDIEVTITNFPSPQ